MRGRLRAASRAFAGAVAAGALALAGCAGSAPADRQSTPAAGALSGEVRVYAAASLQAAFDEIALAFETANPGVDILPIVYDGSRTLATQIAEGAPVDVFASADEANMAAVAELVPAPELFATNTLVVAVPEGNAAGITTLEDLADPAATVVLCADEVPCGAASQRLFEAAGLTVRAASYEQNVTAVLTKIAADEADAGLVYATDVVGQPVESFTPAGAEGVVNRYPIGVLETATDRAAAEAFVAYVVSGRGEDMLGARGFGAP
ncbi:molybdate ABC transporter substrate-binding protein [Microbacterium sp. HA-8]|uniref:molybdate ABC transporter substrate-binding protein n=1 Tax=unclassified Microbacterium TaxID=2609290 RepID=UPI0025CEB832|nr:molybdate ABC transporter substrate-binding protein [Microbacterium sp.]